MTDDERAELDRLRGENAELRQRRDQLEGENVALRWIISQRQPDEPSVPVRRDAANAALLQAPAAGTA